MILYPSNFIFKNTKFDIDLKSLAEKLPVGRSEEEKAKRKDMFKTMDQNGSGEISLAELDLAIKL